MSVALLSLQGRKALRFNVLTVNKGLAGLERHNFHLWVNYSFNVAILSFLEFGNKKSFLCGKRWLEHSSKHFLFEFCKKIKNKTGFEMSWGWVNALLGELTIKSTHLWHLLYVMYCCLCTRTQTSRNIQCPCYLDFNICHPAWKYHSCDGSALFTQPNCYAAPVFGLLCLPVNTPRA